MVSAIDVPPHVRPMRCRRTLVAQNLGDDRQEDERQHHRQILDDQPADGHPAIGRVDEISLFQRLEQNHGAGNGDAEAEDEPGAEAPAPQGTEADAEQRRER